MARDIPTAASKATAELQNAAAATSATGEAAATASVSIGALVGAIALGVIGIAAFVFIVIKAGQEIFSLSKRFAEHALEVGKLSEEYGLATETVSALSAELEVQGRSFNDIKGQINEFRKLIGQAAAGSEDAKAKLKSLGIDGSKAIYDVDSAFKQAVSSIVNAKDPIDQARLAYAGFGTEGYKLLPFLREFNGNVDAAIAKARELGIVVGGDDVKAAKEFHRSWTEIQQRLDGIVDTFGRAFGPAVLRVLDDINAAVSRNKEGIKSWANATAEYLEGIVATFEKHPYLTLLLGGTGAAIGNAISPATLTPHIYTPPSRSQIEGTPGNIGQSVPDPAAEQARRDEAAKIAKEIYEASLRDWDATIKLAKDKGSQLQEELKSQFEGASKTFEQTGDIGAFQKAITDKIDAYNKQADAIIRVISSTQKLKDQEASKQPDYKPPTKNEVQLQAEERIDLIRKYEKTATDIQTKGNEQIAKRQSQDLADYIRSEEERAHKKIELSDLMLNNAIQNYQAETDAGKHSEKELLAFVGTAELEKLNLRKKYLLEFLKAAVATGQLSQKKFEEIEGEIKKTANAASQQQIENSRELTQEERRRQAVVTEIGRIEKENADAAQVQARRAAAANDEKLSLEQQLAALNDAITNRQAGINDDLVREVELKRAILDISNRELDAVIRIDRLLGGKPGTTGLGGGLGSILSGINGGSLGGLGGGSVLGGGATGGSQGGSILDRLRNIFSTDQGGIFAPRDNALSGHSSRLGGIAGGIGDLATIAGGLIGGRAGGILSAVGAGVSIGAMFGPWGALIGGAVGLLAGIFAGDPKKKADKNQNIPALQKGFADATTQLNKILDDLRHLNIDPDEAITQATAIRADIASGFGIQFQSSKYRKQAQQMIAQQLSQADTIIAQIRTSAEIARGAADRSKRILPEFAGGNYFADFFKPNGLLPGMFDGRDNILAMISRGEMVLNPNQQRNIRAMAGFDVFAGAGIPNYPNESSSPKLAVGGIAGAGLALASQPVIVQPNFTLELTGVTLDERVEAYLTSDQGRRTQIKVVKKMKKDGDIT
jgi:hypothetical protein